MAVEQNYTPELFVAVEHFFEREMPKNLLTDLLGDGSEFRSGVKGLWVPRSILASPDYMEEVSKVARGRDFSYRGHQHDSELAVIYDTACSGGISDVTQQLEKIAQQHPAPKITFTMSASVGLESIKAIVEHFKEQIGIDFILQGIYPENTEEGTFELYGKTEKEYTRHVAHLALKYGLSGIYGFGRFAKEAVGRQKYVALGTCVNEGGDYLSAITGQKAGNELPLTVTKRQCGLYETMNSPADLQIVAGRTLFYKEGKYVFSDGKKEDVLGVVSGNLRKYTKALVQP